ncbi:sodium/glutamate symporter [Cetobacterium sp. 2A]|uniref:sodium/glutamate symporter n=2 Tax=unclassified Cetobacterium TaxID=2630983 RepID=UPI00163D2A77|nr:sodium/glutamate symporter [Cetobacterium sp. 2A]MBC2857329.1 sodium/glutamate symporter [Cetobacterium sp. 2A]
MNIELTTIQTIALSVIVLYLGKFLNSSFKFLKDNCIPDAVTGGTVFSVITLIGHETGLFNIIFEDSLRNIFMIAFFTTVGYSASLKLLKKAGLPVLMFLIASVGLAIVQNVVGVSMAQLLDLSPFIGLATGSMSTTGGPGTAGAFGPILESYGAEGATVVAMATATYALIAGSIIAGPIANRLIKKNDLLNKTGDGKGYSDSGEKSDTIKSSLVSGACFQVIIAMGIGSIISKFLSDIGVVLPSYIGAMFAAAVIRNISDYSGKFDVHLDIINAVGNFTLMIFLSMTLMSFKLWELKELAGPLVIMLVVQTLLIGLFAYFITFRLTGKDYDAVVMTSGHCGCGFGTTPKALANMEALTAKYLPSPKAFFVIPIVGGLFIDFFNAAIITFFMNVLK